MRCSGGQQRRPEGGSVGNELKTGVWIAENKTGIKEWNGAPPRTGAEAGNGIPRRKNTANGENAGRGTQAEGQPLKEMKRNGRYG